MADHRMPARFSLEGLRLCVKAHVPEARSVGVIPMVPGGVRILIDLPPYIIWHWRRHVLFRARDAAEHHRPVTSTFSVECSNSRLKDALTWAGYLLMIGALGWLGSFL